MSETSKNKIYYNDNENSVADVLADMKKMAESTDKAIENSKYNDAQIKKDISDAKKEQALKDAEQDNKIIELQTEKAKLETELKEIQEDFYQASIRGQASGEYIHVEDSSGARCKIGISGNSEQETRSGKNKIEITKTTTTVNGCTHTIKDGTDTLSGTSSTNWANLIIYSFVGDGKTYTLSGSPSTSKNIFISAHDNVQKKDLATSKNGSTGTFVATSGNSIDIIICVAPNLTLANELFKPQLEEGLKTTGYEQGGVMPSPDYPSEVQTVGSNVNIFDKDNPDMFLNGLTPDNSGNIVSTLTDTTKTNYIITIIVPCKGNKQYTISRWLSGKTFIVYESEKNKFNINDKVTLLKRNDNSGIINETIATSANAKYILVKIYSTWGNEENTYNDLISSIKIEKGKVATPHSKFGQGCVKVTKCNKNLFPLLKSQSKENKGIIFSYNAETQEFSAKGTTTNTSFYTTVTFEELKYLSKDKKYILSISNLTPKKCMVALTKINVINNGIINEGKKQTTVDNLDKYKPDGFMFYGQNLEKGTKIDFTFKAQIEEGLTETSLTQHEEQTYIMPTQQSFKSVGDIRDTFIKKDGKWYERHNIYRYLFTGNENFKALDNNSIFGMRVTENKAKIVSKNSGENLTNCLSNRFVNNTQSNTTKMSNKIAFSQWSDAQFLYLSKIKDSVGELKSYLAANETYVDYPLETPIDIECTEEQSKILDELNNARTYKNVTNITTDSKAILSLDYAKDQETQNQKMQNEIDEIKQLLSTTQTSALLLDNMQTDIESEVK